MAIAQSLDTKQSWEASSRHQSHAHASIDAGDAGVVDVSDNEENEAQLQLNEHKL